MNKLVHDYKHFFHIKCKFKIQPYLSKHKQPNLLPNNKDRKGLWLIQVVQKLKNNKNAKNVLGLLLCR